MQEFTHTRIQLPSGISLEMSMFPPPISSTTRSHTSLAVLLHPWSWLGGSMDDPVLNSFVDLLHDKHFHVITYNGRGVGDSSGWPSFSGLSEVKDLEEVVQWGISKIARVRHVFILGYSYGSLVASLHPVLPPPIKTSHMLLSYPLDKRGLLTLFHSRTYADGLTALVRDSRSDVLIAYGDHDQFTAATSYKSWVDELQSENAGEGKGKLQVVFVPGASHFWDRIQTRTLQEQVGLWLDSPDPQ